MTFEEITYSESIETVNAFGTKKWFKSGTKITDINGEVAKATQLAKEYVSDTIKQSLTDNPTYVADPTTFSSKTNYTPPPYIPLPDIQVDKIVEATTLEDQIKTCTSIKVLETYQFIVRGNQKLQTVYDRIAMELKFKQSIKD